MTSFSTVVLQRRALLGRQVRLQAVLRSYRMLVDDALRKNRGRAPPSLDTILLLDMWMEVDAQLTRVEDRLQYLLEPDRLDEEEEQGNRVYDI